jgi:hypothetical protein
MLKTARRMAVPSRRLWQEDPEASWDYVLLPSELWDHVRQETERETRLASSRARPSLFEG